MLGPIGLRGGLRPGCRGIADSDSIADSQKFGEIGRDDEDCTGFFYAAGAVAAGGEVVDELVDGGFGADVDAAGRFVEEEDVGIVMEEAGEGAFLLVAAGEIADGLKDVAAFEGEGVGPAVGGAALGAGTDEAQRAEGGRGRRG